MNHSQQLEPSLGKRTELICTPNIFTGISSKIHDARVLKLSNICDELPSICDDGKYHILGDEAYSIKEFSLPHLKTTEIFV